MSIEGRVQLDSTWETVMYLSIIDDFKYLNAASYQLLLAELPLDSTGRYFLNIEGLPENDYLYRLHIQKRGDPISTIIIGGDNQNFVHFLANSESKIIFNCGPNDAPFSQCGAQGEGENNSLLQIFTLQRNLNSSPKVSTAQNRQRLINETRNEFLLIIEKSPNMLIKMLALHFLEGMTEDLDLGVYKGVHESISSHDSSSYVNHFKEKYDYLKYQQKSSSNQIYFMDCHWPF